MSETQSADNDAARRTDEGAVPQPSRTIVTIAGTVSLSELQPGDVIKNIVFDGIPVRIVRIAPPAGFTESETSRRVVTITGFDGDAELEIWLWKFSRVERVEHA